jgi:hypothetical protein
MIYIIKDGENRMKIGYSKSIFGVRGRLKALKTGNPSPLKLSQVFDGTMNQERALHRLFSKYRASGEWFCCSDPGDRWFYVMSGLLKMDGPKILGLDSSEAGSFLFCPGLNPKSVPVLDLRKCSTQ